MTMGPVPGHDTPHSNHCQQRHPGSLIIIVLLTFNTSTNIKILTQNKQSQTAAGLRFGTILDIERETMMISRNSGHQLFQIAIKYY